MHADETPRATQRPDIPYIEVRRAAARAAVAASKVTGRPVSPIVQELANSGPPTPRPAVSGWRRLRDRWRSCGI